MYQSAPISLFDKPEAVLVLLRLCLSENVCQSVAEVHSTDFLAFGDTNFCLVPLPVVVSHKLPDILTDDRYPDVRAFMKTYRKAEAIVTQYNQDLAEWGQAVKNRQKPAEKQHRPPERQNVRNRLRQLQEARKQNSQPKQRKNFKRRTDNHGIENQHRRATCLAGLHTLTQK